MSPFHKDLYIDPDNLKNLIKRFKATVNKNERRYFSIDELQLIIDKLEEEMDFDYSDAAIIQGIEAFPAHASFRSAYIRKLQREMKYSEAVREIKRFLKDFPDEPEFADFPIFSDMFEAFEKNFNFDDIVDDDDDDDDDDYDSENLEGFENADDVIDQIIEQIKQDIKKNPNETGLHFVLALNYLKRRNFKLSLESLIIAMKRDKTLGDQLFVMAMQFTYIEDKSAEIKYFKKLSEEFPLDPRVWLALSNTYNKWEDYDKEIEANQYVISIDPDLALPYYNIGCSYLEKDDIDNAHKYLQKAIKLDNRDFLAYSALGECYIENGEVGEAVKCFQKALSIQPSHEPAILGLLDIYYENNAEEYTDKLVKKTLKNNSMSFELLFSMLEYYDDDKKTDKIIELVGVMLKSIPSKKSFFDYFVAYCCNNEEYDLSLAVVEHYINERGIAHMVNYYLSALYFLKNEYATGERYLELALLEAPKEYETFLGMHADLLKIPNVQRLISDYLPD